MLTDTDIPPGGEGKIEVTFDSGNKKGQQRKSITVESNDPRSSGALLYVSGTIEVVFGFDEYSIDFGKIRKGQSITKTATLIVKDPTLLNTIKINSSSANITAKILDSPAADKRRLTVEITGTSSMPVGRINATITVRAGDRSSSQAALQIRGSVVGYYDISPEFVRYFVDTSKGEMTPDKQVVTVVGTENGVQLQLLDVNDADGRLALHVDTSLAGKKYEITMLPTPATLRAKKNLSGSVTVRTDDKEQPVTSVTYSIIFGRR